MSAIVRGVKNLLRGGSAPAPAKPAQAAVKQSEPAGPAASIASGAKPEQAVTALRRRRGSRTLLSQERMDAELGLGGGASTLGGE